MLADAERLPFAEGSFEFISIGFGLRNVTRQDRALTSMYACLKPGGKLLVLEFSRPTTAMMRTLYDAYSYAVIPGLGRLVARDRDSYQYLVESIRKQPPQAELSGASIVSRGMRPWWISSWHSKHSTLWAVT